MSDETKNKPALEDNFAELEDILKQMEQPEISLEESFSLYQQGVLQLKDFTGTAIFAVSERCGKTKRVQCDVRYRREKDADFKCQRETGRFLRCRRCIWRSRYGYQSGNRQTYR